MTHASARHRYRARSLCGCRSGHGLWRYPREREPTDGLAGPKGLIDTNVDIEKLASLFVWDCLYGTACRGCDDSNDECNVHYNSTIPSHAMYLMAQLMKPFVAASIRTHLGREIFDGPSGPFVRGVAILAVLWLICFWLYKRKIFIKI